MSAPLHLALAREVWPVCKRGRGIAVCANRAGRGRGVKNACSGVQEALMCVQVEAIASTTPSTTLCVFAPRFVPQ